MPRVLDFKNKVDGELEMIKCLKCGSELNDECFCPKCGFLKDNPFRALAKEVSGEFKPIVDESDKRLEMSELPKFPCDKCLQGCMEYQSCQLGEWRSEFVAQLEAEQLPRILDAITELIDDRSDFQKGYKKGYVDAYQRVLEAFR